MEQEIRELLAKATRARRFAVEMGSARAATNLRRYAIALEAEATRLLENPNDLPAAPDIAGPESPKDS